MIYVLNFKNFVSKKYLIIYLILFIILPLLSIGQPARINDGLIAYYPFNGNTLDESGNENNGNAQEFNFIEDRFGRAASAPILGGSNFFYVDNRFNFDPGSGFSITGWVWVNRENFDGGVIYILGKPFGERCQEMVDLQFGIDKEGGFTSYFYINCDGDRKSVV